MGTYLFDHGHFHIRETVGTLFVHMIPVLSRSPPDDDDGRIVLTASFF